MENTFSILPMSQEFTLKPGESYTGSITIMNPDTSVNDFPYFTSVSPYNVVGEDYQADLSNPSIYSQIVDWINIKNPRGTLKPGEKQEIEFTINVPENAYAGGQYATIMVSSDPSNKNINGVSINNIVAMASIIYADIEGEIIHDGTIVENNIPDFVTSAPINISALLSNSGNTHETAFFTLDITNNITGEQILPTEGNNDNYFSEIIMPETTRLINHQIENLPILGNVKIKQTIYYENEVSTVTRDIVICPIWFMALISLLVIGIFAFIITKIKHRHRKKSVL